MNRSHQLLGPASLWGSCLVAIALLFLNLDGYHLHLTSPWGRGEFNSEPPIINWVHGWPIGGVVRSSISSQPNGGSQKIAKSAANAPLPLFSRWPIDDAPLFAFSLAALFADVLILLLVVAGAVVGLRRANASFRPQFGLRGLFLATAAVSIVLAFGLWQPIPRRWLQIVALTVAVFGIGTTGFAVLDPLVSKCRRLAKSRT